MKRIVLILIGLVVVLVAACAIFIVTFDVNRYRPQLVQALEKQFNRPVTIGRISLAWSNGLAVEANAFAVYPDREAKESPQLKLEKVQARVRLMPLLQKKLEVVSIVLSKPYILVEKRANGVMTVGGITPPVSAKEEAPKTQSAPLPVSLSIEELRVEDARIIYRDSSGPSPMQVEANNIDVRVRNFSLTKAFDFDGKLSVFSASQNVSFEGQAELPEEGKKVSPLKSLTLRTELQSLDLQKLSAGVPAARNSALESMAGRVEVKVEGESVKASLNEGNLRLKNVKSEVKDIAFRSLFKNDNLTFENFSANFGGGGLKASGKVTGLSSPMPRLELFAGCEDLKLGEVIVIKHPNAPTLDGQLSFSFEGTASGLQWPQISQTLNGVARIQLEDGVFLNYNALREVIRKISVIPGVEDKIRASFPQVYQGMMNERHTFLKPMDLTATVQNGIFYFNPLVLQTDVLAIVGAGQFGLADLMLNMGASLRLNNQLSGYLMSVSSELGLLANAQGQLELPLSIRGRLPQIHIIPDTQYITSRLLASKTQEIVTGLVRDPKQGVNALKGILGKAAGAASNATSTVTQ